MKRETYVCTESETCHISRNRCGLKKPHTYDPLCKGDSCAFRPDKQIKCVKVSKLKESTTG